MNQTSIFVQGRSYAPGQQQDSINRLVVSPNFFQVMGMPLFSGGHSQTARTTQRRRKSPSSTMRRPANTFPIENPIGKRFGSSVETSNQVEVVGVLRDAKYDSIRDEAPTTMYVPHLQTRVPVPTFAVRTAGDPESAVGAIRDMVRQIDPNVPVTDVSTQMEQVERRLLQEKTFAQAYALFGMLSLIVAAVGLFGVMSYAVSRRTSEIGIRIALGAQRGQVLGATMRESLVLVAGGLAIGLGIAIGASRFVASLLFGVAAQDATTIAMAMVMMALVAAFAAYLPARRASRVDPMVALRYE